MNHGTLHVGKWRTLATAGALVAGSLVAGALSAPAVGAAQAPQSAHGAITDLSVTAPATVQVPSVVTEAATAVSLSAATLQGTVNPNGLETTFQFQYGTSVAYGLVSPLSPQGVGSGTSVVPVTASLAGLSPDTTYDFRLVATNGLGTGYGANLTFTTGVTPPPPSVPSAVTEAATAVSLSAATLQGTVNPNGLQTTYQFQYGTSTSYGLVRPLTPHGVGSGSFPVSVRAYLAGLSPDTTYDFRLVATNSLGTGYGANLTFTTGVAPPPPTAPSAVTEAATAVSLSAATLQGAVNPNGLQTTYQFQYGTSTSYGLVRPLTPHGVGSGSFPVSVRAYLAGLSPDTTYDFRLVATNSLGTGYGANLTFTTGVAPPPPTAPSAVTEAATAVSLSAATLQGTVNPNGLETTFQFQYGTSVAYGLVSPLSPQGVGSGTSVVPVTASLAGLSPDTTYDFRLVATNSQGTGYGANLTFTTGVTPSPSSSGQQGYVWVNAAGGVVTYGNVSFEGDVYTEGYTGLSGSHPLPSPIVGAAALANGSGYYLVAADGSVYSFGAAPFLGSMYGRYTNGAITGIAVAPGRGYYLVSANGSVWNFDAPFFGSRRGLYTNGAITGIAVAPGRGYYLVSANGSVWNFDAPWFGSRRGLYTNGAITGIAVAPGRGYYLVSSRGSVWNFDAPFFGSLRVHPPVSSLTGIWLNTNGTAYILFDEHGHSFGFVEGVG